MRIGRRSRLSSWGSSSTPRLEVYVPATIRDQSFAVEVYYAFDGVQQQAQRLRDGIIPLAVGALVVLQLVQIPIAMSWAARLRRQESERAELMQRSITASELERRSIAADIHDGPVQDLAGVAYALTGLRGSISPDRLPTVDRVIGAVRHAVQSLRRLMIDIYPPDLSGPGLPAAVADLAASGRIKLDGRAPGGVGSRRASRRGVAPNRYAPGAGAVRPPG